MTPGACIGCVRFAFALELVGPRLEAARGRIRSAGLLLLEPSELIRAVGGTATAEIECSLEARIDGWDPASDLQRGIRSACLHGGGFGWPEALAGDPEPPRALFVAGDPGLLCDPRPRIAVVGARRATEYGRSTSRSLARALAAAGGSVVSGLALGIDGSAHRGALDSPQGRTVAVVGGGVDRPYPATHSGLHDEITRRGCIVSEMPPGSPVWRWSFPARNRLIAALSDLVLVVEAASGSGSLHTAEAALMRDISVAAVPGPIDSPLSAGSNRLLVDGAQVVDCADALLALVGLEGGQGPAIPPELAASFELVRSGRAGEVLAAGGPGVDALALDLARLELEGLVTRAAAGQWRPTR